MVLALECYQRVLIVSTTWCHSSLHCNVHLNWSHLASQNWLLWLTSQAKLLSYHFSARQVTGGHFNYQTHSVLLKTLHTHCTHRYFLHRAVCLACIHTSWSWNVSELQLLCDHVLLWPHCDAFGSYPLCSLANELPGSPPHASIRGEAKPVAMVMVVHWNEVQNTTVDHIWE